MSSSDFLSWVQLENMTVRELIFDVNPRFAESKSKIKTLTNISLSIRTEDVTKKDATERYMLVGEIEVKPTIYNEGAPEEKQITGDVIISGAVSVPCAIDKVASTKEKVEEYLQLNLLSIFYSHARSIFITVAGWSPIKDFVLPAIDPKVYINGIREQKHNKQGAENNK